MKAKLFLLLLIANGILTAQESRTDIPGFTGFMSAIGADEDFVYVAGSHGFSGENVAGPILIDKSGAYSMDWPHGDNILSAILELNDSVHFIATYSFSSVTMFNYKSQIIVQHANGSKPDSLMLEINGVVNTMIKDNKHVYIAGRFGSVNDETFFNIMRFNIDDFSIDLDWKPNIHRSHRPEINALAIDENYIYLGGRFTSVNGHDRKHLVRLSLVDGSLDLGWSPEPNYSVSAIIRDADTLYVGGSFGQISGTFSSNIVKLNKNNAMVYGEWTQPNIESLRDIVLIDNYLYCATEHETNKLFRISKYNGTKDWEWNPQFNTQAEIFSLAQMNNKILATVQNPGFAGYNVSGFLASIDTISAEVDYEDYSISFQFAQLFQKNDSTVLLAGSAVVSGAIPTTITRFSKYDYTIDLDWIPIIDFSDTDSLYNYPSGIISDNEHVFLSFRKRYFGLYEEAYFDEEEEYEEYEEFLRKAFEPGFEILQKIDHSSGEIINDWTTGLYGEIICMVEHDGSLYVGGQFKCSLTDSIMYIAKIDKESGAVDREWNAYLNKMALSMAIENDTLYVGGAFTEANGLSRAMLARFDTETGDIDEDWNFEFQFDMLPDGLELFVNKLIVNNKDLYAVMNYGIPIKIERHSGTIASDWKLLDYVAENMGFSTQVFDMLKTNEDVIFAGIPFNMNNERIDIGRLDNKEGLPDPEWKVNTYGVLEGIGIISNVLLSDNKLYVTGFFTSANNRLLASLAVFDMPPPVIEQQAQSKVACVNSTVHFQIVATSEQQPVKYQWQELVGTDQWSDIPEANSPTLTLEHLSLQQNESYFRCLVWNRNAELISDTVSLFVGQEYLFEENAEICDGSNFVWFGNNYLEQGTYYHHMQSMHGCDSTYVLNLTVNPVYKIHDDVVICYGDTIGWHGESYSESGTYEKVFTNAFSCDSIYILNLDVVSMSNEIELTGTLLTALQENAIYQWIDCENYLKPIDGAVQQIFEPLENGSYAVEISYQGCTVISECFEITTLNINDFYFSEEIKVVPNPNPGIFEMQLKKPVKNANIELINSHGQVIKKITGVNGLSTKVELYEIPSGLYFLSISDNEKTMRTSFVLIK